jgi:protein transport protein SEC39
LPEAIWLDSLLKATHILSEYRLVLRQGEPFSPVVLRVHSDPISIVEKLLEQNPKSYTRVTDLLEVGVNLVKAGLTTWGPKDADIPHKTEMTQLFLAEKRITAMCIEAALREDDFETAYSYVVNRLTATTYDLPDTISLSSRFPTGSLDDWSWKAALRAGQYIRTGQNVAANPSRHG